MMTVLKAWIDDGEAVLFWPATLPPQTDQRIEGDDPRGFIAELDAAGTIVLLPSIEPDDGPLTANLVVNENPPAHLSAYVRDEWLLDHVTVDGMTCLTHVAALHKGHVPEFLKTEDDWSTDLVPKGVYAVHVMDIEVPGHVTKQWMREHCDFRARLTSRAIGCLTGLGCLSVLVGLVSAIATGQLGGSVWMAIVVSLAIAGLFWALAVALGKLPAASRADEAYERLAQHFPDCVVVFTTAPSSQPNIDAAATMAP